MTVATLKYWIWLATRRGFSPRDGARILQYFGSPEGAYFADPGEYEAFERSSLRRTALLDKSMEGVEKILADCDRLQLDILTIQDARYPERLRQIADPPCVLYVKGKLPAMDDSVAIGVVGSRNPTGYGLEMAGRLGLDLARSGAIVVSGIAQGIDSAALIGALQGGGTPVSVLGGGIDIVYPYKSGPLYADVAATGAIISEYPPGTEHEGWHFPVRNRIISGLSVGVVAVEAAAERSGTLITARLALDQDRDVFAFPGPANAPMSGGTNGLIQRGEAKLILSARDVLSEYELVFPNRLQRPEPLPEQVVKARIQRVKKKDTPPAPVEKTVDKGDGKTYITLNECRTRFSDDERDILLALASGPLLADELVERTQFPARRVLSALTMLQVQGGVKEEAGKRFSALLFIRENEGAIPFP